MKYFNHSSFPINYVIMGGRKKLIVTPLMKKD